MPFRVWLILPAAHRALSVRSAMRLAVLAVCFAAARDAFLDSARFVAIYRIAGLPAQDYSHHALSASHFAEYAAALLAEHRHPSAARDLAHCARTVIADLINAHRLFVALALLSRFGYAAAPELGSAVLAQALVALAQGQLCQH